MHGHGRDREESRGITRVGLVLDGPGPDCQSERMHVKVAIWWRIASGGEARRVPIYIYTSRYYREFANSHTRLLSALTPRALPRNSANAEWPTLPEAWVKFADGSRGDIVFPRTWIDLVETNARGPILSSLKFSDPPRCSIRRRGDPDGRPPSARWLRGAEFRLSGLRYLGTAFRPLSLAWIMSYLFLTLDCTEGKTIGEGCVP